MYRLFLLLILFALNSTAQQANFWYFGVNAGMHFTPTGVNALTNGALVTNEGCATISDGNGALMFYTDGVTVWDKSHVPMVNGTGLLGGTSSTQAALIVPDPGNINKYYIFTTDETGGPNGFRYSQVDMTVAAGMGGVDSATKNTLLLSNVTEKLTATSHSNGVDVWVTVHEWGTAAFYSYLVNASGIQAPVVSTVGSVHLNTIIQNTYGQMKFSPCGNRLALTVTYQDIAEIFDFNNQTGVISNAITLNFTDHVYGLEFAQEQQYLYVTGYDPAATLMQFDITSNNATLIQLSMYPVSTVPDLRALQIGPDGKIYVAHSFVSFVGCIGDPDVALAGCNFNDMAVNVDPLGMGTMSALGLPGFVQSYFKTESSCTATGVSEAMNSKDYRIIKDIHSGDITIYFDGPIPEYLEIMDVSGRSVKSNIRVEKVFTLNDEFTNGVYFILMHWEKGISTEKISF